MRRARSLALLAIFTVGCDVVGGGGGSLPEPELGVRRVQEVAEGPVELRFQEAGTLLSLTGAIPAPGEPAAAASGFVDTYPELFGFDRGGYATEVAGARTLAGADVVGLRVTYRGVEVEGGLLIFVVRDGRIRHIASSLPPPAELEVTPTIAEADALAALAALYTESPSAAPATLVIADLGAMGGGESSGAALAWRVEVEAPVEETAFVSATDGAVLMQVPTSVSALERRVVDAAGADTVAAALMGAVLATEATGVTAPMTDADAHAIYGHLETAYDYWQGRLGWDSYDGFGGRLDAAVRYSEARGANAFWNERGHALLFTPGMTTEDIVGHELTHAVESRAGFGSPRYSYRSGALNESLADTFAAFLQSGAGRWTIGEGSPIGVLRDMSNPPAHGMPAHPAHLDDFLRTEGVACSPGVPCPDGYFCRRTTCTCVSSDCDFGHVHANSGIINHAMWLAADGGRHVSRPTSVDGVGVPKLERVLFEAMSLLSPSTRFDAWRDDVLLACRALIDDGVSVPGAGAIDHRDCGRIVNAFAAVGIGTRDRDEDSFDDDHDNCPAEHNPEQLPDQECVRDPYVHCRAWRYGLAFDRFLEGVDIGFERNEADAAIMVARCAFANRDYLTSEDLAARAGARGSPGEAAIAYFIAEYAAERMGRASEGYRDSGLAAAERSGMCSGISDPDERAGCAGYQRAGTRAGLE